MILVDKHNYAMAEKSLRTVDMNNLFARSVLEGKTDGFVYGDRADNPQSFYVVHPYGMSLLFGETENTAFNTRFLDYALNRSGKRAEHEWLQPGSRAWDEKLRFLFGTHLVESKDNAGAGHEKKIEKNTRVNFKFNPEKYFAFRQGITTETYQVRRTDLELYRVMEGTVVPKYFWRDAADFYRNGVGFSLMHENKLMSTAFSSFINGTQLELGIQTNSQYSGKGFAAIACSALIDYCIENGYEPVWACRLENTGSYKLAQKLGFEVLREIPYYRLAI
jgi:hypothetical protein